MDAKKQTVQMPGLDIGKFVCSILVLISHMGPFDSFNTTWTYYSVNLSFRFAVPFFFLSSGYMMGLKCISEGNIYRYIKRIFSMYFIWTVIYVLFDLPYTITFDTVINFLLRGSLPHFWYFPSLIFSVLLIYILMRNLPPKVIFPFVFIAYFIGLLGDSYWNLLPSLPTIKAVIYLYNIPFLCVRNGILFPSIFVYIGAYLARNNKCCLLHLKENSVLYFLLLSYALFVFEFLFVTKMNLARDLNIFIFIIPTSVFIFLFLKGTGGHLKINGLLYRKMSTFIYCSHRLVSQLVDTYILRANEVNSLIRCIIIIFSTCVLAFLYAYLSVNRKYESKTQ